MLPGGYQHSEKGAQKTEKSLSEIQEEACRRRQRTELEAKQESACVEVRKVEFQEG